MTTTVINNVPRDDLDLIRVVLEGFKPCIARDDALRTVRALLSAPSPAGVDGLEVFAVDIQGREVVDCVRHDQHQAIIDGLRGEADQQAQRIGELASHLEFAVTMLTVAGLAGNAQVKAMRSALSAGKEVG